VRGTLTPQLDAAEEDTTLVLIDLGHGKHRMGGSILGQVLGQAGDEVPDLDDAQDLVRLVDAVNALRARARSWPTTTAATAACWPPWPRWPLPATWAWR
jgi:phosphoribosylformylglycinamidine synthase